jgi:tetratricopeptide (TPR) repeat protein
MTDPDAILRDAFALHQAGSLDDARVLYELVLALRPADHDALHLLGLLRASRGETDAGIDMIRRAVAAWPGFAVAHFNLGGLLLDNGHAEAALDSLRACLALLPDHAGALAASGRAEAALRRADRAVPHFQRAAALRPGDALLWNDLGSALYQCGRFAESLQAFDTTVGLLPGYADGHANRGCALLAVGDIATAAAAFQAALDARPGHPNALLNLAFTRRAQDRPDEALDLFSRFLALDPDHLDARLQRATVLCGLRRYAEAVPDFTVILDARPDDLGALAGRGGALWELLDLDAAEADLDRALAIDPGCVSALVDRGNVWLDRQRFTEALTCYDLALDRQPGHVPSLLNRCVALQATRRSQEALPIYRHALTLRPDDPEIMMNIGMCLMRSGNWRDGWKAYEARWSLPDAVRVKALFPAPPWDGRESPAGRRILLLGEQGLGDMIQYCRFARHLADRGATVILGVEPVLGRLLRGIAGVSEVAVPGDEPEYDACCPMLSLPAVLGLDGAGIPTEGPYLAADPDLSAAWRARLAALPGLKVGLARAGDPRPSDRMAKRLDLRRSVALARLAPLLAVPGVTFVSLQKGQVLGQYGSAPIADWTDELLDYADTAALMAVLDLVITVDTSVAHAAGALGRPVWVLNRFDRCWRWMEDRDDTPWYPTMRLFTQAVPDGWEGMAAEAAEALRALVAARE